ncbi:MAG: transglycosylase domain-containing protein, partial [Kiritimatiellae bacterium]|nr:transglycosylase domain-containing protein [Kiritimatiellia bacterium]
MRVKKRLGVLSAALLAALAVFAAASWLFIDWPAEASLSYPGGVVLRDAAGNVLRVSLGPGDVDCRPWYAAAPDDWIVKAVVASEDGTFFSHCGVRPFSVLRAAFQNIVGRRRVSGASTITMQAVRLVRPHPKTYWWKWKEAVMALKLERAKDKGWIISQYLNRAPFGSNLVGIEAAAQGWFGKGAKDLGLGEAALLAGMVQAPSRFRPDRGYDKAIRRRDYVLSRMRALGMISDEQVAGAQSVRPVVRRSPRPFAAPHFCDWYLAEHGRLNAGGADLTTPLDADMQEMCERAVASAAEKGGFSSAAVVVRVSTGDVVALASSDDYFDARGGQVNLAASPRPAGSTLKPFLAALAMERGLATPERRLLDAPLSYRGYRPANFDGNYRGPVTLRDALVLSLNIPFVSLLEKVGVRDFALKLRELGFSHVDEREADCGLGLAIGNVEVSLVELVRASAVLARGGDGLFSPGAAYLVSDMLSGPERSQAALGHVADVAAPRFAWKTGTSSAYRDAWTVAWNPDYAIGVWCGHKSGGFGDRTLVGARAAAPVAWTIARALYPGGSGPWFAEPADVARRAVCKETGLPASPDCPGTEEG